MEVQLCGNKRDFLLSRAFFSYFIPVCPQWFRQEFCYSSQPFLPSSSCYCCCPAESEGRATPLRSQHRLCRQALGMVHPEGPGGCLIRIMGVGEKGMPWQEKVTNLNRRILPPFCFLSLQCSINMICWISLSHKGMMLADSQVKSQEKRKRLIWEFSISPHNCTYSFRTCYESRKFLFWCSIWNYLYLRHSFSLKTFFHLKPAKDWAKDW